MLTYGDGVADIDLAALTRFHDAHGRLATVTAVRPPARFGAMDLEDERVASFAEKPHASGGWINGGYFVLEPEVIDYIDGDDTSFEGHPLERLEPKDSSWHSAITGSGNQWTLNGISITSIRPGTADWPRGKFG